MKNKNLIYVLFIIVLLSAYSELLWTASGRTFSPYYNMTMGAVFTCFAFLHGSAYTGRKSILSLAALPFLISFVMEYAGVRTGLIYGEYHYGSMPVQNYFRRLPTTLMILIPHRTIFFGNRSRKVARKTG